MAKAFQRLERILNLEVEQGYKNKAVVGGIRQFATFWVGQARDEAVDDADSFFIEQVAETLTDYNRLPGREARADTIRNILEKIEARKERVGKTKPVEKPQPPVVAEKPNPTPPPKPLPQPPAKPKAPVKKPQPVAHKENTENQPKQAIQPDPEGIKQPVTKVKGVGAKIADLLGKMGVSTVGDMLDLHPRRYDDYTKMLPIQRLTYGEVVTVIGTVWSIRQRRGRNNRVSVHAVVGDGSGTIQCTWFGQPWLSEQIKAGMQIVLSGKVDQYLGRPVFNQPEWEPLEAEQLRTNRIVPVYPLTKGLGANQMRRIMKACVDYWAPRVADPLPASVRNRHKLTPLTDAVRNVHFPRNQESLHKAQQRLMFDELFLLQLGMLNQRRNWQQQPAQPLDTHAGERIRFFNSLPFEPTGAQKRVVKEISADMARQVPMNRLLQGDVGAGKTLVAAAAIINAVKAGVQAALMAPTEILAEQHYAGLSELLEPLGIQTRLLTGGTSKAQKTEIYAEMTSGSADFIIGTTALIQPAAVFANLGFVVIDEQHRFGVDQRGALRDKGKGDFHPHLLVMTATPIPRSLAHSIYGDLDLSILDEMPPGRQEILTRWLKSSERERAYGFIRRQAAEGRQAFIIYPLVEESEKLDVKAAVTEAERLQKEIFPTLSVGLIHGRMKSAEKDQAMRDFKDGKHHVLVATTVIEVGIDVPNSTVIVIDGANRFGLAQLHQLRGRVGRGQHKSYCILISDSNSSDASERLKALEDTNDGFQLAEKDLQIRGPGEFFGRKQSGIPELQLATLFNTKMVEAARTSATKLLEQDTDLTQPEHALLRERVAKFWEQAGDVS